MASGTLCTLASRPTRTSWRSSCFRRGRRARSADTPTLMSAAAAVKKEEDKQTNHVTASTGASFCSGSTHTSLCSDSSQPSSRGAAEKRDTPSSVLPFPLIFPATASAATAATASAATAAAAAAAATSELGCWPRVLVFLLLTVASRISPQTPPTTSFFALEALAEQNGGRRPQLLFGQASRHPKREKKDHLVRNRLGFFPPHTILSSIRRKYGCERVINKYILSFCPNTTLIGHRENYT